MPDLEHFDIAPSESDLLNAFGQLKYFGTIMLKSLTKLLEENNTSKDKQTSQNSSGN